MNKPITEAGSVVVVESYWADFAMKDGMPRKQIGTAQQPSGPRPYFKACGN